MKYYLLWRSQNIEQNRLNEATFVQILECKDGCRCLKDALGFWNSYLTKENAACINT